MDREISVHFKSAMTMAYPFVVDIQGASKHAVKQKIHYDNDKTLFISLKTIIIDS